MKKRILLFTLGAGISILALSSYHSGAANNQYDCTGAEAASTGAFTNSTGCFYGGSGCHSTTPTSTISVVVELDSAGGVPTTHYKGGLTYTVKITGTDASGTLPKYGFQLAASKGTASAATVADAGTWATTGLPASTHVASPSAGTQLTIPEQSTALTVSGGTFTQSFTWTAPTTGTGTISLWGVTNFVNGDGSAGVADKWNTTHDTINEWSTVSVPSIVNNMDVNVYPNPVVNTLNIALNNVQAGNYTLQAFDLNGKMVANQTIVVHGANHIASINTNNWVSGLYQVVIANGNNRKITTVSKL